MEEIENNIINDAIKNYAKKKFLKISKINDSNIIFYKFINSLKKIKKYYIYNNKLIGGMRGFNNSNVRDSILNLLYSDQQIKDAIKIIIGQILVSPNANMQVPYNNINQPMVQQPIQQPIQQPNTQQQIQQLQQQIQNVQLQPMTQQQQQQMQQQLQQQMQIQIQQLQKQIQQPNTQQKQQQLQQQMQQLQLLQKMI